MTGARVRSGEDDVGCDRIRREDLPCYKTVCASRGSTVFALLGRFHAWEGCQTYLLPDPWSGSRVVCLNK